jgi:hypothetical protein
VLCLLEIVHLETRATLGPGGFEIPIWFGLARVFSATNSGLALLQDTRLFYGFAPREQTVASKQYALLF